MKILLIINIGIKMKYILVLLFLLATGIQGVFSQSSGNIDRSLETEGDSIRMNIQEAVLTALERNPNLSILRLDPAIMKSFVNEQRSIFDPNFTVSATRSENKMERFLGSRPDPFELTSKRNQYNAGISETLPTGTNLSIDASLFGSISSIYLPQYSGNIELTITQSLLRGFGTGPNLANLRKARIDLEISNSELKGMAERLVADTEMAYWELYLTAEESMKYGIVTTIEN